MLWPRQALQLVLTKIAEGDTSDACLREHIARRLRDEHLPATCCRTDTRSPMDVEAEVAPVGDRWLSCVDTHADRRLKLGRPLVQLERPLCRDGCAHSVVRIRERAEELIRSAVHFDPGRSFHCDSHQTAVIAEHAPVKVAQPLQEQSRPLDVGEEKRDSPARQRKHRDHLRSDAPPSSAFEGTPADPACRDTSPRFRR